MSEYPSSSATPVQVRWAELLPDEFRARRTECPLAWLPLGLCEPHGHVAAFGLDTIKADWLCDEGARRYGGVVAPTQGWHVHETGYHARWLEEVIGEDPAEIGTLPPDLLLRTVLYQLRALANAGFRGAIVLSGHAGGNQEDLRRVAAAFSQTVPFVIEVFADPDLVKGRFVGDHAGKFEISQLLAIRPDLVALDRRNRGELPGSNGQFALGEDAGEATAVHGRAILAAQLEALGIAVDRIRAKLPTSPPPRLTLQQTEAIWKTIATDPTLFVSAQPWPSQSAVSPGSQWKAGEYYRVD